MCPRDQVSCPANAQQGITSYPANDARVHDLIAMMAVASKLDLLRTQVSRFLMRTKSHGPPNSFALRNTLSCDSGNPQTPQGVKFRTHRNLCGKKKIMSPVPPRFLRQTRGSQAS